MKRNRIRLTDGDIHRIVKESVNRIVKGTKAQRKKDHMKQRLKDTVNEQKNNGVIVYRGMDKGHKTNQNVWVTDSVEYAQYWAKKEYNENGVVNKFFLPNSVIQDLCNADCFEELMNEYDAWQAIPDDSPIWEEDEDVEYDLMHDLCFPSSKEISILKNEGYKGILFKYDDSCHSILIFNSRDLKTI